MPPPCLGPSVWKALHNLSRGYEPTPEKQQAAKQLFQNLGVLFPCGRCGRHIREVAETVEVGSRVGFIKWLIDFHNSVNKRTGKPVLTYAQAVDAMMDCNPKCPSTKFTWNATCTILACIMVVLVVVVVIMACTCRGKRSLPEAQ
jgi:hypothetical protein